MAIEAAYFARKFGLTKDEALKTLKEARVVITIREKSARNGRTGIRAPNPG
ncbi:hypothetical protein GCM10010869_28690 [Mesorhizobium tianshanense]|uniref:hypothetical protein n=1 Tax=Mesorhizobium tianshanense TaxID=39844 RepID=UPI0013912749|nr:hypothetical protein [Mesorhizobium tianshanense]GLS37276.1 hypothetical protein GCM10010869_28690 [Mesorhizobium tianshanense]